MEIEQVPQTVNQIYQRVLGRESDPQGLLWYGSRLWHDEMSVKDVVKEIALSPEYMERFVSNRPTDEAVKISYEHFLAREPDATGLAGYQLVAQAQGFRPVITGLLECEEYQQKFGTDRVPS